MNSLRLIVLLVAIHATGCATLSEIDGGLPREFHERFSRYPVWMTTSYYDVPGTSFPGITFLVSKKWWVKTTPKGRVYLQRYASTSILSALAENNDSTTMFLDGDIDPRIFLPPGDKQFSDVRSFEPDEYSFRDINGKSFEISVNSGQGRIVFFPAPNNHYAPSEPFDGLHEGIWAAPFGPDLEVINQFVDRLDDPNLRALIDKELRQKGSRYYLHHDIASFRTITVIPDETFPEGYLKALDGAIANWNEAIGTNMLKRAPTRLESDYSRCLSEQVICVRWKGPRAFSFRGLEGTAHVAFDPTTGLITGAIVTFINDRSRDGRVPQPLTRLSAKEESIVSSDALSRDQVAKMVLESSRYLNVEHPYPTDAVEAAAVHELGHALGLSHNFAVNPVGTITEPTLSVMAYPPFPITHRFKKPTNTDRASIRAVYKQDDKKYASKPTSYCGTVDAMTPRFSEGMWFRPFNCGLGVLGNKIDWLMALGSAGKEGVLSLYPDMEDLTAQQRQKIVSDRKYYAQPPLNVLSEAGLTLAEKSGITPRDRRRLAAWLCTFKDSLPAIKAQLVTYHRVDLLCDKPEISNQGAREVKRH